MKNNNNQSGLEKETIDVGGVRGVIYRIRGREVMLDAELAKIYGYTTRMLNQQVMRNTEKFKGEDFMFRLTSDEYNNLMSQNATSSWGGTRKLPYAFTEQGVYMLMTVLRGELAVKQSRALVMAFKTMKDYLLQNRALVEQRKQLELMTSVVENGQHVKEIEKQIEKMDKRLVDVEEKMENAIMRNEISPIMLDFNSFNEPGEFVFMNGEVMEAKEMYQKMYSTARKSVYVIDDYIDIRTLRLLGQVRDGVMVTIISDNVGNYLHYSDYEDFRREYSTIRIKFVRTCGLIHDRFVIIDFDEKSEVVYHCGASSKDAGKAVTVISKIDGKLAGESMKAVVSMLMNNQELKLK